MELLRLEADLTARIEALFRRCPALCGFSVQDASMVTRERAVNHVEGDLFVADLACHPGIDREHFAMVCEEVSHALLELVDEQPEAAGLLAGRTFARTLH
jgi:hypothetical protein